MHQLDFKVTVNCGSFEALRKIERMLTLKGAGALFLGQPLFNIVDRSYHGELSGFEVDIHSVDINEDITDEAVYVCYECSRANDIPIDASSKCGYARVDRCARCGNRLAVYPVAEESISSFEGCTDCGYSYDECGCEEQSDIDEDPFDIDSFSDGEERFNRMLKRRVEAVLSVSGQPELHTVCKVCHTCNCNRPCECDYEDYVAANIEASIIGAHDQAELPEQVTFIKRPSSRYVPLVAVAPGSLFETEAGRRAIRPMLTDVDSCRYSCVLEGTGEIVHLDPSIRVKVLICEEDDIPF